MNKVFGEIALYAPIRIYGKRTIISYDFKEDEDGIHATWYEIYFSQKVSVYPSLDTIKKSIIADINSRTDEKILSGFMWRNINVWLSSENQFNFKAAYDLVVQTNGQSLPVKFKIGETENKEPVYHTFETMEEFTDFYTKAIAYINKCLNEGWELKDSIDWSEYEIPTQQVSE